MLKIKVKMDEISIIKASTIYLEALVGLENKIWPEGTRASKEKFEKRLRVFPEGFFLAVKNNILIGASTSEIIQYDTLNPPTSWESITDNGYIEKTHNPEGNALYIVSIGAISRSGAGSALLSAQKELARKLNLRFLVLGARIPSYNKYCIDNGETKIEDYVKLRRKDNQLFDDELRFYTRNGLILHKIMPNYMEDDKESRNYGAIMMWENH